MSSLRMRSIGGAKVLVDSSDTTPDFLSPKLVAGSGITFLVQNLGGNENILVSTDGKLLVDSVDTTRGFLATKLVTDATITKTILAPGGNEQVQLVVNLAGAGGLDGRYIKRSPSAETQTILPLTDNVPLTVKAFAGGAANSIDIFDNSNPQVVRWSVGSGLVSPGELLGNDTRIRVTRAAASNLPSIVADFAGDTDPRISMYSIGVLALGSGGVGPDTQLDRPAIGILRIQPGAPDTLVALGTLAQLALLGNEGGAAERRIRENAGAVEVTDTTPTVLRSLLLNVTPTTLGPASAPTIGTSTGYSRGDHIHGIDTSIATGFDGRYIKRSPTGENQTILPLSDSVALTVKGFAGGASDVLDIFDSTSPTQLKKWSVNSIGNLVGSNGAFIIQFAAGLANAILQIAGNPGSGQIQLGPGTSALDTGIDRPAGGVIRVQGFVGNTAQLGLLGQEAGAAERRIRENAGKIEFTDLTPTVLAALSTGPTWDVFRAASNPLYRGFVTGETNPRVQLLHDQLQFGAGGASVPDTTLVRTSGGAAIRLTIPAGGPASTVVLSLLGTEVSASEVFFRENAGALEVLNSAGTIVRSVITRGAPNVAVAHNATSVAVSFSTSEPDTSYEITVVPAYNTTFWYTSKTATGFTVNFGTAGPVGGSTFDWHIERIPRT